MGLTNIESELLLKKAYRTLERIKSLKKFLSGYGNVYLSATGKATSIKESIRLIYIFFEQVKKEDSKAFNPEFLSDVNSFNLVDPTYAQIIHLEELVQSYIDFLEYNYKPQLSVNEKQLLSGLRNDLNKLKEDGLSPTLVKNLVIALEELEKPNYLTCAMVSARATLSMVEKIKAKSNNDEDKAKKLEEIGAINKGEIAKQTYKFFLEAVHSARHLVLHEIGYFPDYTDATNFLSSSFKMAKLYLKYERAIESNQLENI